MVESISFAASAEGAAAVAEMERIARESGLESIVLRLARLWGPGTWNETREREEGAEFIHVRDAARLVCEAALGAGLT